MKRLGAWLALLAIGLHAVWPLLANARPGVEPLYNVVCTEHGTVTIPAGDAPKTPSTQHCEFCPTGCTPASLDGEVLFSSIFLPENLYIIPEGTAQRSFRLTLTSLSARAPPVLS